MLTTPEKLRSFGITPTVQRVAVYDLLHDHPAHQTAEEVYAALQKTLSTISLATVYNTLKVLTAKGALWELRIEDGVSRYDANLCSHAHFKCVDCGMVYDLWPAPGENAVPEIPGLPENFTVQDNQLCCRGTCSHCRKTAPHKAG
ncbi:MAG: transcriptional repressor [Lentisphaeria bacterium]|nr:transcriptional repressor [Lentisphaeria bacterium]